MDLEEKVKHKSSQLLLQNSILQQRLCAKVNTSEFGSFLITFIVAPFIVGAVAQGALGCKDKSSASRRLTRAALPVWRLWSLL